MKLDGRPFGKPDAADKGIDDLADTVDVGDLMPSFDIHNDPTKVRILFGRKGAGKTHALKLLEQTSRRQGRRTMLRAMDADLSKFGALQALSSSQNIGVGLDWERLWRVALVSAAMSLFIARSPDEGAASALEDAGIDQDTIREDWAIYCPKATRPLDPIGALIDLVGNAKNPQTLSQTVMSPRLNEAEAFVSSLLRKAGPVHYFLDGFDDYGRTLPQLWMNLQLGLFWLSFRLNTTRRQLRGVSLTVALREEVLALAQTSIHADRFDYGESMMLLTWSREAAKAFFRSLLWKVRNKSFWTSTRLVEAEPEISWLGQREIHLNRPSPEPIIDYLVRHTRCTPRDIILLGNRLASELNQAPPDKRSDPRLIDRAVSSAAEDIGKAGLKEVADDLMRDERLPFYKENYKDEKQWDSATDFIIGAVEQLVNDIALEVIARPEFEGFCLHALTEYLSLEGERIQIAALVQALWRNGIIAVQSGRANSPTWKYLWSDPVKPILNIPTNFSRIGFHPSMFEIAALTRCEDGPVF